MSEILARLANCKSTTAAAMPGLGESMIQFFKHSVEKRQTKLSKLAECWGRLVPESLSDHCALESFSRGTLVVVVDSSPHLYELKQLLLAGLQDQLVLACKASGLRKISLRHGRWYAGDSGDRKVNFTH
jgi:hypothetical protein